MVRDKAVKFLLTWRNLQDDFMISLFWVRFLLPSRKKKKRDAGEEITVIM